MKIASSPINVKDIELFPSSLNKFITQYDEEHPKEKMYGMSESDAEYLLIGFANARCLHEHIEEELDVRSSRELLKLRSHAQKVVDALQERLVRALVRPES